MGGDSTPGSVRASQVSASAVLQHGTPAHERFPSKIHAAPEGTFPETIDWSKLTVGGLPIPEHLQGLVPWASTDQATEERRANRKHEPSGIEFGADPLDKGVEKFRDGLEAGVDPWDNPDPLHEKALEVVKPGERHRFLSPRKITQAGLRGWVPKVDVKGNQVTVGEMILATMPEDVAKRRDKRMRAKADAAMVKSTEREVELTEQALDLTLGRNRKKGVDKGFESYRGDPNNFDPEIAAGLGV